MQVLHGAPSGQDQKTSLDPLCNFSGRIDCVSRGHHGGHEVGNQIVVALVWSCGILIILCCYGLSHRQPQ